ncbi:MAG: putative hemolysin [Parvicella sp.]
MDPNPIMPSLANLSFLNPLTLSTMVSLGIMVFLILLSALMSGSEVAFFSISKSDQDKLQKEGLPASERVLRLIETPKRLLATILIANNFINVAIVAASTFVMKDLINENAISKPASFLIQVVFVTFIILLFGEVMPKVYAVKNKIGLAKFMAPAINVIKVIVSPLARLLVASSTIIDKRIIKKTDTISVNQLEHALNITRDVGEKEGEKKILEGIIKFGNTDAKQIMTPRIDVLAFDNEITYRALKDIIVNSNYSRVPVFKDSFDTIEGVLYIKDLLPHIEKEEFDWKTILRTPKFITENKKLDDLLLEFQGSKTHMAIVVDEYGGTSGIVTLEDVLEEIVGDITDEFDDEGIIFTKVNNHNYVFEGKTPLMDMYRVLDLDGDNFEEEKGESDTIAGFCIEQAGKILLKGEKIIFEGYTFTVEAADKRRIKQVKVTLPETKVIEE